jgi:hypothetical protein
MLKLKDAYTVSLIPAEQTHDWLLHKHYAHRIPQISYAFGLFDTEHLLQGVCSYGTPCRMLNHGYALFGNELQVSTLELNRLVVNGNLNNNTLSYFISQTLIGLPRPCCLVSYADGGVGHHGYIYQATNWIYTGITKTESVYTNKQTGEILHPRTVVSTFGTRERGKLPDDIIVTIEETGKYRYLYFLGSKKEIAIMKKLLKYPILPYPKGDNQRYNASYQPEVQLGLL